MKGLAQRRKICDKLAERYYPPAERREHRLRHEIEKRLAEKGNFLDAGSGPWFGMARHFVGNTCLSVGMDLEPFHAEMMSTGVHGVRGDLARLPFADESFDVVCMRSVLEHIGDPATVFSDIHRVLRPGGWLIALAPSRWYFASVIGRLTPDALGRRILEFAIGPTVHDNYPVYYRVNTPRAVRRAALTAGFEEIDAVACPNPPGYLKFSPMLFRLGVFYDRLAGRTRLTRVLQASFLYSMRRA